MKAKSATCLCVSIALTIALLTGCVDFYTGKRPIDYPNTRWVSENPDMYFEVGNSVSVEYAQIMMHGEVIELICGFDHGVGITFYDVSAFIPADPSNPNDIDGVRFEGWLFMGLCEFSKDKLVAKITNNGKGFLDKSIKEITFLREDIQSTTTD